MEKQSAINEAMRLKGYFPFRVCGIIENKDGTFRAEARKTMSVFNRAAREGRLVFILRAS